MSVAGPKHRALQMAAIAAAVVAMWASPADAHGFGSRGDLPLPLTSVLWGGVIAIGMSFALLGLLWSTPRMARAAAGVLVPIAVGRGVRGLGLIARILVFWLTIVVVIAGITGSSSPTSNIAPVAIYLIFWVGMQLISGMVGDVWSVLSPADTIAAIGQWARRMVGRDDERRATPPGQPRVHPVGLMWAPWVAASVLFGFLWLELAYHDPASPQVLGVAASVYLLAMAGGTLLFGRHWLRHGDGFAVLFGLLARMAPFRFDDDGRMRARWPFAGLSTVKPTPGTAAVIFITLGATTFDGLSRTRFWKDAVGNASGWTLSILSTIGLVSTILLMAGLYYGAAAASARMTDDETTTVGNRYIHSLVPIMLAYAIAHYFSLFVFEGQAFMARLSDPFGRGWNILGTADWTINFLLISTATIAWVQVISIVGGHIAGVTAAHDRSVETTTPKLVMPSQYPFLVVMILYTVGGLLLLFGA